MSRRHLQTRVRAYGAMDCEEDVDSCVSDSRTLMRRRSRTTGGWPGDYFVYATRRAFASCSITIAVSFSSRKEAILRDTPGWSVGRDAEKRDASSGSAHNVTHLVRSDSVEKHEG